MTLELSGGRLCPSIHKLFVWNSSLICFFVVGEIDYSELVLGNKASTMSISDLCKLANSFHERAEHLCWEGGETAILRLFTNVFPFTLKMY